MAILAALALLVAVFFLLDPERHRAARIVAWLLIGFAIVIGVLIALVLWAENTPEAAAYIAPEDFRTHA